METTEGHLRIGELSQRTGVSPERLRAWERRYGLLRPSRSPGGFRLYSDEDEARIRRMTAHLAEGVAAAEAARLADAAPERSTVVGSLGRLRDDLDTALETFDEASAQRVLDSALSAFSNDSVISELLVPYLHELGARWERGDITVAQEHFASNVIRSRMLALARSWDAGYGPRALLACPEGELHDLGLVLFGVALVGRGWRITFLGANTPLSTVADSARSVHPDAIVIGITDAGHVDDVAPLVELARDHRLFLAGRGVEDLAPIEGATLLSADPVAAAELLAAPTPA